jgi:Rieske Fe-S protein
VQGDLVADNHSLNRRQFLNRFTTTLGGTVAVAAVGTSLVHAEPKPQQDIDQQESIPQSKGYSRTQHVDTYYQLADF